MSTGIQWTDETWNPIRGCSRVSEGCRHCYAEVVAARFSGPGQAYEGLARRTSKGEARWTGKIMFVEKHLLDPLRWKEPRRIFVNSMSDLFHEDVTDDELAAIFGVMALAHQHTFQILTKRPERQRAIMGQLTLSESIAGLGLLCQDRGIALDYDRLNRHLRSHDHRWPLPNVWLGVSIENQEAADERIPLLLDTPAAVRFLSCEPLLGPLNLLEWLDRYRLDHDTGTEAIYKTLISWVIFGGESGAGARPCDVQWIRDGVSQCREHDIAPFVKQMGKWIAGDHSGFTVNRWLMADGRVFVPPIIRSVLNGHLHDRSANAIAFGNCDTHGGNWNEWPEDLRVREFPAEVAA